MQNQFHTIIIGAGISGLSAAVQLSKNNLSVLILEANDYIGGRIKTIPVKLFNGTIFNFEEGANWIHDSCGKNPITKLSNTIRGVKLIQTDDQSIIRYDQQGQNVDKFVDKEQKILNKMFEKLELFQQKSLYQAIQKTNGQKLKNKYFMHCIGTDIQFQTATTINKLSAEFGADQQADFDGRQMLVVSGYQQFAINLSKQINGEILLNHKVRQIIHDGKNNIVKCENNTTFIAKNIIISVPLGILKSQKIKFSPILPIWKRNAIEGLGFGNICKVLITLNKKLDLDKEHYICVVSQDVNQRGSATIFLNLSKLTGLPALMTFGLGPNADQIQTLHEQKLKLLLLTRIRTITDTPVNLQDFSIVRSQWRSQANIGGSYSYAGVYAKPKDWANVAKPIFQNNWYFCGQHTHSKYRSTVHGAYMSGKDAAQCIIKQIQEQQWKYRGKRKSQ